MKTMRILACLVVGLLVQPAWGQTLLSLNRTVTVSSYQAGKLSHQRQ